MGMKKNASRLTIGVNGRDVPPGGTVSSEDVEALQAKGPAGKALAEHFISVPGRPAKNEAALSLEDAILQLDHSNDDHWTKGGKPDLRVLGELTRGQVTRAMVEEIAPDFERDVPENGDPDDS